MSDDFQQTSNNDENKKEKVMTFNYKLSGQTPLSDITENKIVVMDYTTTNLNSFNNLNSETIVLHKLNVPYEDIVKMFKEKLIRKILDAKYVMSDKDAINLDKMMGLAYVAMSESEKNNKLLRTRNSILQNKHENYDRVVTDCNELKSEINKIKINLCLALGRRFNDKEDVTHLTNFCAALAARENEYHYILKENDKLKYVINKQLMDIRKITSNNYNEILQSVEKFKEELYIKDLKISQLKDELCSINEEKNIQLQLLHDNSADFPEKCIDQNVHGTFECSQNNELFEGKMLIAEQINQIQGSTDFKFGNHQLCDLINMLARLTANKEEHLKTINRRSIRNIEDNNQQLVKEINDHKKWQNHLENENEKLNSEFEDKKQIQKMLISKINENKELKKDYSKIQLMYDELNKKHAHLKTLLDDHRQLLTEKKMKCVDGDNLIKTLQLNLAEQTNKFELAIAKYNKEKEKCQKNETYTQQMVDEFTRCVHEKEIDIVSLRNECSDLKHHIKSEEDYIGNLKHEVITLESALNEKNRTIQDMLKAQRKQQQQHTVTSRSSSLISDDQLHINSKLEHQMDILLDNICTWKNIIVGYEKVLYNMQNVVQQQSKKRNYWMAKYQHLKDIEYKADKLTNEKELILFQHQKEMENIKEKYNSEISHMAGTEVNLRNEIQNLKESLKLKSFHLMRVEKIASSQLKESLNIIEQLTTVTNIQPVKLNEMENVIPKRCCDTHLIKSNNKVQQLEGLVDYMLKLKSENKFLKRLCKIREQKIMSLENSKNKEKFVKKGSNQKNKFFSR